MELFVITEHRESIVKAYFFIYLQDNVKKYAK